MSQILEFSCAAFAWFFATWYSAKWLWIAAPGQFHLTELSQATNAQKGRPSGLATRRILRIAPSRFIKIDANCHAWFIDLIDIPNDVLVQIGLKRTAKCL